MAILETCCFWKNVRQGSFACGVYTMVYFGFSALMLLFYVHQEKEFLFGEGQQPIGESILEKGDVTVVTVILNIVLFICSVLMVLASILLIVGLQRNKRQFLIPWILLMLCDLCIEFGHLVQLSVAQRVVFDPIVGFIFTIDFFILCLNIYCLLCVISQYQQYREQTNSLVGEVTTPIVVFTAPPDEKISTAKTTPQKSRRLLATSPLITSQRPTNFSTITEEEEQHKHKTQPAAEKTNGHKNKYEKNTTNMQKLQSNENGKSSKSGIPNIALELNSLNPAEA